MRQRYALVVAVLLSAFAAASVPAAPSPQPVGGTILPLQLTSPPELKHIGPEHADECMLVYMSEDPAPTSYYAPGAFVEVADDLHTVLTEPQALCAVDIGYFSPTGPTDIIVTFYDNAGDAPPVAVTAGSFPLPGAPMGANFVHVELPVGIVTPSTWMGVAFSNPDAGLIISEFPTVGTSHDYHYETPPGDYFFLGGDPLANYWLGVYTSPSVQTESATWGKVKAIYR